MTTSQFDDITKKIDDHFEKSGVVLVGMHQELQEQKHRIGQYHEKVDAVTNDLNRRRDEIVADLRTRAEIALSVLEEVNPLVQRIRAVAQDANDAIESAGETMQISTQNLSRSHTEFRVDAEALIGSIKNQIVSFSSEKQNILDRYAAQQAKALANFQFEVNGQRDQFHSDSTALIESIKEQITTYSSETGKLLKQFSDQQAQSIAAARNENHAALQAMVAEQAGLLVSAQNVFGESIARSEEKLSAHMDAHKRFLKSSYDELKNRQRASDAAFATLKAEAERHQARQIAFAQKTRLIFAALVVAGFAVISVLVAAQGVALPL